MTSVEGWSWRSPKGKGQSGGEFGASHCNQWELGTYDNGIINSCMSSFGLPTVKIDFC